MLYTMFDGHFDSQAFAVAGPKDWNQLPVHIWAQETVSSFNMALITHFHSVDQVQIMQACHVLVMTVHACYDTLEIVGVYY